MKQLVTITIDGLRLHCRHGVLEQERSVGNEFEVTLAIRYPVDSRALVDDDLSGTLDYSRVVGIVRRVMDEPSRLLEHAARRVVDAMRAEFPALEHISITIVKLAPPIPGISLNGISVTLDD